MSVEDLARVSYSRNAHLNHLKVRYTYNYNIFQKFQRDCMSSKEWKPWQQVGLAVQEGGVGGRPGARGGKVEEKVGKVEKVEVEGGKMIQ